MSNYPPPQYSGVPTPPPGSIMPTQAQQPREPTPRERIDRLKVLAGRALAYWKVAAAIVVVGLGLSLVTAMRVKLIYRSETVILYKPAIKTNDHDEESPADRAQRIAPKLKEVLITRSRLEGIIKEFDLYPKIVESRGMIEAVDQMRDHVGFRGRDSETFFISFENESPEIAQKVTARLADSMIDEFTKSSVSEARQQAEFLGQQEQKSADEVESANKQLATFLTLHPEFAMEASKGVGPGGGPAMPVMPLPKDPAAMGDSQLSVLLREKARLEGSLRATQGGGSAATSPGGQAMADQIAKLTAQRDEAAKQVAAAQSDLAEKKTRLTDAHPDVIAARAAVDQAARQLHAAEVQLASAQALASGQSQNPYAAGQGTENSSEVQRRIARLNAEISARQATLKQAAAANLSVDAGAVEAVAETNELVQLETEWQRLLRVMHDVKNEHDDLKQRLERAKLQANAAVASGGDQMQILDAAYKPMTPSQGGRTKTAMMGGIATLMLAIAYAFARVLMNDTIIDAADVEALHVIPVLGVLPKLKSASPSPGAAPTGKGARGVV